MSSGNMTFCPSLPGLSWVNRGTTMMVARDDDSNKFAQTPLNAVAAAKNAFANRRYTAEADIWARCETTAEHFFCSCYVPTLLLPLLLLVHIPAATKCISSSGSGVTTQRRHRSGKVTNSSKHRPRRVKKTKRKYGKTTRDTTTSHTRPLLQVGAKPARQQSRSIFKASRLTIIITFIVMIT